jgi:hypothetical protein
VPVFFDTRNSRASLLLGVVILITLLTLESIGKNPSLVMVCPIVNGNSFCWGRHGRNAPFYHSNNIDLTQAYDFSSGWYPGPLSTNL